MQEQITIGALRFQFLPDEQGWRFDTIPFYLHYVKDFLLANEGEVAWIRGRLVERNAYLVFKSSLEDEVVNLLKRALHDLERVKITVAESPWKLFHECINKERVFEGCLELGEQKIGELKKPTINVKLRDNYVFICPYIENGKCTLEGYHGGCILDKAPIVANGCYGTIVNNLRDCERIKVIMESGCSGLQQL